MSDILQKIVNAKREEVNEAKKEVKITDFESMPFFGRIGKSLKSTLLHADEPMVIAEFKRRSPSAGDINKHAKVQQIVRGYEKAGAAAISVLTNEEFFGGSYEDLKQARQITEMPILRKDFIVDELQVYATKSLGADIILLIAEALTKEEIAQFAETAKNINLEVLLEIHSEEQLDKLNDYVDFVGVNNRNLKNFDVSIQNSLELADKIPDQFIKISESGLSQPDDVKTLYRTGYQGFLIGGYFMEATDPVARATDFIKAIQS